MSNEELTARQRAFVAEYLCDLNGKAAAIRAGYSPRSAEPQASRLLRNGKISEAIDKALEARAKRTEITADKVVNELAKIGFSDMRKFSKWGPHGVKLTDSEELAEGEAACVQEVSESVTKDGGSIKFKLHDKKGALELLGKHLGLFTDKVDHSGELNISVTYKKP